MTPKKKGYLSLYLSEDLRADLDEISADQDIPRNRLIANILSEVVQDFKAVKKLEQVEPIKQKSRVFFISRYLDK